MTRVAVITATVPGREELLAEARASVAGQTIRAEHVVVADDHRAGAWHARNVGARAAGPGVEWLAFLDDDDLLDPDHLEALLAEADRTGADVVYSPPRGHRPRGIAQPFDRDALEAGNYIAVTSLVRRRAFDAVGGFPDTYAEDYALWLLLARLGYRFARVDRPTWTYRRQTSSKSTARPRGVADAARAAAKVTDRPYVLHAATFQRDGHPRSRNLLRQLAGDAHRPDTLRLYDNGSTTPGARRWLDTLERTGRYGVDVVRWGPARGIYAMWNDHLRRAVEALEADRSGRRHFAAVLNNDLTLPDGFLHHLGDALYRAHPDVAAVYPDWPRGWPSPTEVTGELRRTAGTRNLGGLSGFAFLLDVEVIRSGAVPYIDEAYLWLCGDGDLVVNVQRAGLTAAAVVGLPVGHVGGATGKAHPWTVEQGRRDFARSREPGRHNAPRGDR